MMNHNMQMQKETGKILHRKFLSENIGLLLMAPVFLLLMFIVSNLYQLPAEYAFYLTSIFLILWVTTLCMQYRGFRKRTEQYEKESKEKQEIGCQDITKIKRKKLVFNHSIFKTKCKSNNN